MPDKPQPPGVRFLALDGGQFPGLEVSRLIVLDEIVKRVDFDSGGNGSTLICDLFDLIGGTGMGGIFAIFLSVFRMSVREAIKAHSIIDKQVFSTEAWTERNTSKVQKYLDGAIEEIGKLHNTDVSEPLINDDPNACKAFVCTINPKNMSFPRLLRTYRVRSNSGPSCSVREALIATIAGQPYVQPIKLGLPSEDFACAIRRFGNPINQVLDEACQAFESFQGVSCILSIGAGSPDLLSIPSRGEANLASLEKLARDCEGRAEEVAKRYSRIEKFVFRLSGIPGLDEASHTDESRLVVATHTSHYLQQAQVSQKIDQVVTELNKRPVKLTAEQLSEKNSVLGLSYSDHILDLIHHGDSTLRKLRLRALPPRPAVLFGRDNQKTIAIQAVLSPVSTIILGPGGIGKTSMALTVLHDDTVQNAFKHFYFVSCEGLTTLELLYAELSECIGIPTEQRDASRPREQILEYLDREDAVLCIDNFETLWDIDETKIKVQDALADFVNLQFLSLVVTMRGSKPPGPLIWWSKSLISLGPLTNKDAFVLFQTQSGCADNDEYAHRLVEAVDCVPLAIQLLAAAAGSPDENTEELWARWEETGTRAVSQGKDHRLLDLETSIELSLNGPHICKISGVKATLALLSLLPGGLNKQGEIYGFLKQSCIPTLRSLPESLQALAGASLVYMDITNDRRYRLLSPISRYSRENLLHFLSQSTKRSLIAAYVKFIEDRKPWTPSEHDIVPSELSNLYGILSYGFEEDVYTDVNQFALAVWSQSEWMEYLGFPSDDLLVRTISECRLSPFGFGRCHFQLGNIYRSLYRYDDAEASLLRSIQFFQVANQTIWEGNCRSYLGEVYISQYRLRETETSLLCAMELHKTSKDALLTATDRQRLGNVYLRQNRFQEAENSLLQAMALHHRAKFGLAEGNDKKLLGEVYLRQNRLDAAEEYLLQAAELHRQVKSLRNEGTDKQHLGKVYLSQDRLDEAENTLLQAVDLHQQAKFVPGEGNDRRFLAEIYLRQNRLHEAEESLRQAVELHQQAGFILSTGNDIGLQGGVSSLINVRGRFIF